ncbi:MAG TPA: hypothetical protein PKD61_15370, partial [Polyangiaceae bacterium]|nr:hypothetical protein [Polyangiaceae bacterium]
MAAVFHLDNDDLPLCHMVTLRLDELERAAPERMNRHRHRHLLGGNLLSFNLRTRDSVLGPSA